MNASEPEASFYDLEQVACGEADDATRARVQATLENPESPLSIYAEGLREDRDLPLTMALEAAEAEQAGNLLGMEEPRVNDVENKDRPLARRILRGMRWRGASIAAAILLLICVGFAWAVFRPRPLLSDSFGDEWVDPDLWFTPRSGVREEGGHMRLLNRGYLVTEKEFSGPISVSFDWKWLDIDSHPHYSEQLAVVLRTTGRPREQHSFEVKDGVVVRFDAQGGRITVSLAKEDPSGFLDEIGSTLSTDSGHRFQISPALTKRIPMPAEKWHGIRIADDGRIVAVYLSGPEVPREYKDTPILSVRCPDEFTERHIAVYNREYVGETNHESRIDNFVLTRQGPESQ